MKVFLAENKKMTKYQLPNKIDDTFLIDHKISDKEYSILFARKENDLYLKSTGTVNVIANNTIVEQVKISFYQKCVLKIVGVPDYIDVYFLPDVASLFKVSFAGLDSFMIGNSDSCHIQYQSEYLCEVEATVKKHNDAWYISCISDDNYRVYVNNFRCKAQKLKMGDIIFISGLKIVWMGDFICLNNPNNIIKMTMLNLITDQYTLPNDLEIVTEEDKFIELYSKDDYFSHYPLIREKVKENVVSIDSPPGTSKKENLPWILTMGSTIVMMSSSFIMAYNVGYGLYNKRPVAALIPQIVMCIAMLIGSLIIPKITQSYQRKRQDKREDLRQTAYSAYLNKKEKEIVNLLTDEVRILNDNYLSIDNCLIALNNKTRNFWNRRFVDEEFLTLRLGTGTKTPNLEINAPEEHFTIDNDNLLENAFELRRKYNQIKNVPITLSLKNHNIVSLICVNESLEKYTNFILTQLIILHSCLDLKIVILTNEENEKRWEFVKYIPHIFSDDKSIRYFATNEEEVKIVCNYIENEMKERLEKADSDEYVPSPFYVVITDNYRNQKNIKLIDNIVNNRFSNLGISLLVVENTIKQVPITCETFIEVGSKDGVLIEKHVGLNEQKIFNVEEALIDLDMFAIANSLANVPVTAKEGPSVLPSSLSFLEMYKVSKIEQLNILNRWQTSNPVVSLSAIVGVHTNGDKFKLDLHEKFHGPHGLIAGMTGSGKSEFIITYILSMALSYHPYEVQFVLIDYKGGGLAGAFENKEAGIKIPHLVGTITNLDVSEMNRSLVSIQSELTRRQKIFNETREALNEGTIDIYKYQKLYREGVVKKPLSHLFIICDEFAELKQQRPEFMQSLISISRIGRSLGIHLILATQKPSGLVNDQIWANSKFKVCLKVQDRSDSMEMLKRPEAASIKETGRFYLQVGYNDLFDIGQSGWSGAKYVPSDKILLKYDESLNFIDNVGYMVKTIKDVNDHEVIKENHGGQLINLVKYLDMLGEKENIVTSRLWLDPIPEIIYISDLKNKYQYQPESYYINPLIGEYDDPVNQIQKNLNIDLSKEGNLLIYGASGSGKENLLTTLIRSIVVEHTPDEVNLYILDCGAESLKIFGNIPHVGDIVTISESTKIIDFFELANTEIETRKDLFAEYAGNYNDYILNSGKKLPLKIFVINNYDSFMEAYGNLSDKIQFLFRDGAKYGVVFIISAIAANAIRSRSAQYFNNKICLKMANPDDYRNVLGGRALALADKFGRGFVKKDDEVFEFQTAAFASKKDITNSLRQLAQTLCSSYTARAPKIPYIPDIIQYKELLPKIDNDTIIPVGYSLKNKNILYYNFTTSHILPIVAANIDNEKMSFVTSIIKFLNSRFNNVQVVDFADAITEDIDGITIIKDNFDEAFVKLYNEAVTSQNKDINNYYIILGVSYLKDRLENRTYELVINLFNNFEKFTNTYFVFVDVYNGYKMIMLEDWYQKEEYKNNGLWLGESFDSQVIFNSQTINIDDKTPYLAFAVTGGRAVAFKHVIDMEIEDE